VRRFAVVVLLATAILLSPAAPQAGACTCRELDRTGQLAAAQAVFTGIARKVADVSPDRIATMFDVTAVYKGDVARRVTVATAADADACGTPFREDTAYTVFASGSALALTTGLCSGTTEGLSALTGLPSHPPEAIVATRRAFDAAESRTLAIATAALLLGLTVAATAATRRYLARPKPLV